MAEIIITLIVGALIVFFIMKKFVDRETFNKIKFLAITAILVIVGFGLLMYLKKGG